MPVNCPQCGNPMNQLSATQAQCPRHGPYQILFQRSGGDDGTIPLARPTTLSPPASNTLNYSAQQYIPYAQPTAPRQMLGPCQNHPQVAATQYCVKCNAPICPVCDFTFPNEIHLCPRCVTSGGGVSPGRHGMMVAAYAMAGVSTVIIIAIIIAAASHALGGGSVVILGLTSLLLFATIIIGAGLGIGALDRNLSNPISLWIAASWNGLLGLILILLIVLRLIMGGGG